jgi:hypothetical protein
LNKLLISKISTERDHTPEKSFKLMKTRPKSELIVHKTKRPQHLSEEEQKHEPSTLKTIANFAVNLFSNIMGSQRREPNTNMTPFVRKTDSQLNPLNYPYVSKPIKRNLTPK